MERPQSTYASGWFMVSGLLAGHAVFHWIIQSFVVVLPEIQSAFNLNSVGVGGILSARELAAGLVILPGGVIVDLLRRHWGILLAGCLGTAALGSLIMGFSPAFPLLLLGIGIVAISHSLWHLPASTSLSHHFAQRRGMALAFHGVGGSIGDVAGPIATGALLLILGWRDLLSFYAVVPLFLAFLAVWFFRGIGRVGDGASADVTLSGRVALTRQLLQNPTLWGLTVVRGLRTMALVALLTVLPLYLDDELELSTFSRGLHIGLLIAIGLLAKPAAGYLSDRWGRKPVLEPGLVWSCLATLALLSFNDGLLLMITVALLGLFLYPDQPIVTAAVFDVVGREVASTGLGLVSFAAFLMGAVSPLIAGAIYEAAGFNEAVYYIAALFALAALVFVALPLARRTETQPG